MGFFSSLFGGQNDTLSGGIKTAGGVSNFTLGKGQNLTGQAGDWLSSLMSGDSAKTAKLLAPQIKGIQDRAQQQKKTMSQFGNRSGGTNAKAQTIDDTARSDVNNMVSTMTGQAVSAGGSMGQSLIDTGMKALGQSVDFSQQQMENWSNSILGQGMAQGAGALEKMATSYLPTGG